MHKDVYAGRTNEGPTKKTRNGRIENGNRGQGGLLGPGIRPANVPIDELPERSDSNACVTR